MEEAEKILNAISRERGIFIMAPCPGCREELKEKGLWNPVSLRSCCIASSVWVPIERFNTDEFTRSKLSILPPGKAESYSWTHIYYVNIKNREGVLRSIPALCLKGSDPYAEKEA